MSRIRTIKPEFWAHEKLSELPAETHMLAAALLNYADDEGYFNANPKLVQAACLPLRESSVSVHDSLSKLCCAGYLELGTASDGRRYGRIVKFTEHQKINRPTPSKISVLDIAWEDSLNPHAQLTEASLPERKGTGNREQGTGKGKEHETRARRASFVGDFEKWWEVFPNKVGRAAALTAFQKVRKAGGVELETLVQGVERYKASKPPDRAWCNPATWLNQARWLDEPATTGSAYRPRAGPVRTYREIREERERHENDVA